jgi:hypothetical protein
MEKQDIKDAVKEAFKEELQAFYIDRETHYKQHEWLGEMMKYAETCKSVILKTIITAVVGGAITLMIIGFSLKHAGK